MSAEQTRLRAVLLAGQAFREQQAAVETGAQVTLQKGSVFVIEPAIQIRVRVKDPYVKDPNDMTRPTYIMTLNRAVRLENLEGKNSVTQFYDHDKLTANTRGYVQVTYPANETSRTLRREHLVADMYKQVGGDHRHVTIVGGEIPIDAYLSEIKKIEYHYEIEKKAREARAPARAPAAAPKPKTPWWPW